jgi:hypothetical protein
MDLMRTDWYPATTKFTLDPVTTSNGTARTRLKLPLSRMLIHYIGAGRFLNRTDDGAILKSVEVNHARPKSKPNEYNSGSGISGKCCEYAGPWRAAHSSGKTDGVANNLVWWGHVVFLGSPEVPTEDEAQQLIEGVLRSRRTLVDMGWLTPDHIVAPHSLTTPTPCPGPLFDNKTWWAKLSAPLNGSGENANPARGPAALRQLGGPRTTIALAGEGWMSIARRELGSPSRWREIAALNGNTDGPTKGQTVILPG